MKANKSVKVAKLDIGISDKDRAAIAQGLSGLLADSYTLYLMTHNFHWNVTGRCSTPCTSCSWANTPNSGMRST
jgi:hypothetical protein